LIRYLLYIFFFLILILHRPISTLFPYTTLFRSYQFVMRYRIEESKRLLLSRPDLNITNIAELSGFSSLSVFGRAFTQKMNCSPIQWREKNLNQNIGDIEKKAEKKSAKLDKQLEVVVEK